MLDKIDVKNIISLTDSKLDILGIFGETEDQIDDWRHTTKVRINDLMIRASKEVSDRKAEIQTGFKKLNYPLFNGDVLNYL